VGEGKITMVAVGEAVGWMIGVELGVGDGTVGVGVWVGEAVWVNVAVGWGRKGKGVLLR